VTANRFVGALGVAVTVLLAVVGLNAVGSVNRPADQVDVVSDADAEAEPAPEPSPRPPTTVYTVEAGDTVWTIAEAFGATVEDVLEINALADPHTLDVGQTLLVPLPSDPYALPAAEPASAR
jgi:LysM repeat protein